MRSLSSTCPPPAALAGRRLLARAVERLAYPAVTLSAMLAYPSAAGALGATAGAYLVIAATVLCIAAHEWLLPERRAWRPSGLHEVLTDAAFLTLVNMLLPRALALAAILALAGAGRSPAAGLWPDEWPLSAQFVLLTLLAEFPRYWLHRLGHTLVPLWRFHAVHHAPRVLYWLNVGRFHPVDKALQFLVETLPFLLLGVAPEVLGLYFVFYAVAGFYQHSNCRVRLGLLNWILAGPELHRWHHSARPAEGNANYGNKLILWDVVFGTRFLPHRRRVGALGLLDPSYPTGFAAQLAAPFRRRRET
jgi:ornithine lipid hydroxylase